MRNIPRSVAVCAGLATIAVAALGCGQSASIDPSGLLGDYTVTVAAGGKTDPPSTMAIVRGSGNSVLLSFIYGFSPLRCTLVSTSDLTLPRQVAMVAHSTGKGERTLSGRGSIKAGAVDIRIDGLGVNGVAPDGGEGAGLSYAISGMKN